MELIEYLEKRRRSENYNNALTNPERIMSARLGIIEEIGEVAALIKRARYLSRPYQREELVNELSDLLFYIVSEAESLGGVGDALLPIETMVIWFDRYENYPDKMPAYGEDLNLYVEWFAFESNVLSRINRFHHLAKAFGITLSEIMDANIAKLQARYPDSFAQENVYATS